MYLFLLHNLHNILYLAEPKICHLDQLFLVFAYLKHHDRSRILLVKADHFVNENSFVKEDLSGFSRFAKEAILHNTP
jgi:hypothetical protein